MNWLLIVLLVLALGSLVFFLAKLRDEAKMYRMLWIDVGRKLEFAIGERNEYMNTTLVVAEDCAALRLTRAKLNKLHTSDAKRIDSLLHGDRSCVLGHRYWTGEGVSCPHCGARECRPSKSVAIKIDGEFGAFEEAMEQALNYLGVDNMGEIEVTKVEMLSPVGRIRG